MNKDHKKKMIAPVVITVIFLLYLTAYLVGIIFASKMSSPLMLLLAIPLVAIGVGMVYVLIKRIKEIKKGEEDDLSNY